MVSLQKSVVAVLPLKNNAGRLIIDSDGDIYFYDGVAKKFMEFSDGKIAPVEILGTNLPANTGLFNTDGIFLFGDTSRCNIRNSSFNTNSGLLEFYWQTTKLSTIVLRDGYGNQGFGIYPNFPISSACFRVNTTGAGMTNYIGGLLTYFVDSSPNIVVGAGGTVDGLDLSEYDGTEHRIGVQTLTLAASGYIDCVATDKGKMVTDDGGNTGVLIDYNNTTRTWYIEWNTTIVAASVMAITGGTGAGIANADSTAAPIRSQRLKSLFGKFVIGAGGSVTINIDDAGTGSGNAIFTKNPISSLAYEGIGAAGVLPINIDFASDLKTATIYGDANKVVSVKLWEAV